MTLKCVQVALWGRIWVQDKVHFAAQRKLNRLKKNDQILKSEYFFFFYPYLYFDICGLLRCDWLIVITRTNKPWVNWTTKMSIIEQQISSYFH